MKNRLFTLLSIVLTLACACAAMAADSGNPASSSAGDAEQPARVAEFGTASHTGAEDRFSANPVSPLPAPVLPKALSAQQMFADADWVVKIVMLILIAASVLSWTIALAKGFEFIRLDQQLSRQVEALTTAGSLESAFQAVTVQPGIAAELVAAARKELIMRPESGSDSGVKERTLLRLNRLEAGAARAMNRGTGPLASIGATAPFVGLFGTVWGIMNAFIGISHTQTTNLAVVAPGIAEALLATALGLVAAIPAVLIYNYFSRRIGTLRSQIADQAAIVMQLLSREMDQSAVDRHGESR